MRDVQTWYEGQRHWEVFLHLDELEAVQTAALSNNYATDKDGGLDQHTGVRSFVSGTSSDHYDLFSFGNPFMEEAARFVYGTTRESP